MIDSHCHLAGDEFESDLREVIDRAMGAGVTAALVIIGAEDEAEVSRAASLRGAWPAVRFSIGVHPHTAGQFAEDPSAARRLVEERIRANTAARALGEIGLDYHYDFSPRDVQQAVFREQIRAARSCGLPVVIHTREAEEDTFRILEEEIGRAHV